MQNVAWHWLAGISRGVCKKDITGMATKNKTCVYHSALMLPLQMCKLLMSFGSSMVFLADELMNLHVFLSFYTKLFLVNDVNALIKSRRLSSVSHIHLSEAETFFTLLTSVLGSMVLNNNNNNK